MKSRLSDRDLHLFHEGTHQQAHDRLGAHLVTEGGVEGARFAVWAPAAERVTVFGDFNDWDKTGHRLEPRGQGGVWEGFVPGVIKGARYKFHVVSRLNGYRVDKADPFGYWHEIPPRTASVVWDLTYDWSDDAWMAARAEHQALSAPMSVYELHPGSWRRDGGRMLGYRELAEPLAEWVQRAGFTHVELMPVMEHPYYASWGYQVTGYFAPTARYGTPQDLMFLIDTLHQRGIGVILDWVPSHFPSDEHGLGYFDGTYLYEHADPRKGFHPDWGSLIFNYGRPEVRSFLVSSALFWLERYHADGLRVDGVASMLYLDYSREDGQWVPNAFGGRENLEAIELLRQVNGTVAARHPGVLMIAEESTAWPMVTRPAYVGGLGFSLKWDMGWMHDRLDYFARDALFRGYHHDRLTFRMIYAFSESFMLSLSHDEVVHGKHSLIGKMPGDDWQKFANLRLLLGSQWLEPGKKLLFMGGEFGQWREWNHDSALDWFLLEPPAPAGHAGLLRWVASLNRLYREEPALHELDCDSGGYEWVDANDSRQSVTTWLRRGRTTSARVLVACNHTPSPHADYRVGVPLSGTWRLVLNSDHQEYGGSGAGSGGDVEAEAVPYHGRPFSVRLALPPLGVLILRHGGEVEAERGSNSPPDALKSRNEEEEEAKP